MTKKEILNTFKWRKILLNNFEKITGAVKSSKAVKKKNPGQLDLFSMGMEDVKENPKLDEDVGKVDAMEFVDAETELLGLPVLWNPIDDFHEVREMFCTHKVTDLLEMTKNKDNIIVLDRLIKIDVRYSKKGNKYCKIWISNLGHDRYIFVWGDVFKNHYSKLFINEIYLFQLSYREPTPEYDRDSIIVQYLKNIKDVDIQAEYDRIYNLCEVQQMDEKWIKENKPKWLNG